jgi:hypothetical protein
LSTTLNYTEEAVQNLKASISSLIIKVFLGIEPLGTAAEKGFVKHRGTFFEIFGFDVLLDENLKPWLMEVNLNPSISAMTQLDLSVKVC